MKETLFKYRHPSCQSAHSTSTQNLTLRKFLQCERNVLQHSRLVYIYLELTLNYVRETTLLFHYSLSYDTFNECLMFICVTAKEFCFIILAFPNVSSSESPKQLQILYAFLIKKLIILEATFPVSHFAFI